MEINNNILCLYITNLCVALLDFKLTSSFQFVVYVVFFKTLKNVGKLFIEVEQMKQIYKIFLT